MPDTGYCHAVLDLGLSDIPFDSICELCSDRMSCNSRNTHPIGTGEIRDLALRICNNAFVGMRWTRDRLDKPSRPGRMRHPKSSVPFRGCYI